MMEKEKVIALERLLIASAERNFTESDRRLLNDLLRNDPEARALSVRHLCVDALLAESLAAQAATSDLSQPVKARSVGRLRKGGLWTHRLILSAAAALLFLAALPLVISALTNEVSKPVAKVIGVSQGSAFSVGDRLKSGHRAEVAVGMLTISFDDGAVMSVQAPAELTILGPNSARLSRGIATARVPGEIKGFSVDTPRKRIVDLGTSFGVRVERSGDSSVSVFDGQVKIEGSHNRLLRAGQSARLGNGADSLDEDIPYEIKGYLPTWRDSFGVEEMRGDVRFATPDERQDPWKASDDNGILLFPERERVPFLEGGAAGIIYHEAAPLSVGGVTATAAQKSLLVDSYLLQHRTPGEFDLTKMKSAKAEFKFRGEIVAVVADHDSLVKTDQTYMYPVPVSRDGPRRGIGPKDAIEISGDRRVIRIDFRTPGGGLDQIRVLVSSRVDERKSP